MPSWNFTKTAILMAGITALFGVIGSVVGGASGMLFALILGGAANFFAYWFSDKMVLRLYNAIEVNQGTVPELYQIVQELAEQAKIEMPRVYIINEMAPNAFATGRNPKNAAVAATTGILKALSKRELKGVMAHELAHVKNRDTLISTISATMAGAVSALANFALLFGSRDEEGHPSSNFGAIILAIFAPFAAMLIQMAISRAREFEADKIGAQLSKDPEALASALEKIHNYAQNMHLSATERHPETAQMMIINPLSGAGIAGLFSTHPNTDERVRRLRAMKIND